MDEALETLIYALEEEKSNLLRLIDFSVKDQEFMLAHFHFQALRQVNRQLQTLNNLNDDLWDKKNFLLMGIENLKNQLEKETSVRFREYINKLIEANQKELDRLIGTSKVYREKKDGCLIDKHIELLVGAKLRAFRIILMKDEGLVLEIKKIKRTIRIALPHVSRLIKNDILTDENINKLKGLGFQFPDKGSKLIMTLTGNDTELRGRIKTILAIIVFEVFYYKELDKEAFIET